MCGVECGILYTHVDFVLDQYLLIIDRVSLIFGGPDIRHLVPSIQVGQVGPGCDAVRMLIEAKATQDRYMTTAKQERLFITKRAQ
jgi:hypothetical protein